MKQTASMPLARSHLTHLLLCLCLPTLNSLCQAQSAEQKPPETPAQSTEQKLPDKVVALLSQQVGFDDDVPNERNPAGLRMQFSKVGETNMARGHFTIYRAYVAGAAENQKYAMAMWKIGSDPLILPGDVYVNAKGLLMAKVPRPDQENKDAVGGDDEIDLTIQAARGEPVRFILATADGKFSVPGTVVPYPIEGKVGKCRLEARYALPSGAAVLIYADGLPPNTEVPLQSVSAGETIPGKLSVNARGHAATIVLPYVTGKDFGSLKASVATKQCTASVEIQWGKGSDDPF